MDFVLTLHGHLPYGLHHGRWPLASGSIDDATLRQVEALGAQDSVFPDVLRSIAEVVR